MSKLQRVIAAFFSVFLFTVNLFAIDNKQDSIFPLTSYVHYGEEQGLTTKTVYSIIQDHEGFIWMGTDAGVFRYDGKKFKRLTTEDGLTDNEVLTIYQDKLHRIWFLTFNGHVSFWKEGKIYNPDNTPFLKEAYTGGTIRSAFEDREGQLWLGTEKAFIRISGNEVKKIEVIIDGKTTTPFFIHQDSKGDIWSFPSKNRMFKLYDSNFTDTIYLPSGKWLKGCHDKSKYDELSYINNEGVYKIKNRTITRYINGSILPLEKGINNIVTDEDVTWVCTNGDGCYQYKKGQFAKRYLDDVAVSLVLKDREGNLWFSTTNKGLFMLPADNKLVTSYTQSTGLSGEKLISIDFGKGNSIWIGYHNGTVDCISGNHKKLYSLSAIYDKSVFRVTSLLVDSEKTWCGTDLGVFLIQDEKVSYLPLLDGEDRISPYSVKRVFKALDNEIYCTANANMMHVLKGKAGYHVESLFDHPLRTFSGIECKKNNFIIASMTGLMEFTPGGKTVEYRTEADFSSIRVLDMKPGDDNLLILATSAGLYTMKDRKIVQHFNKANGLSDGYCNKVYISGDKMYVATSNGLSILEKKDNAWKISETRTIQNGLPSNAINDVAVDKENIYVATDVGLSVIKKTDIVPTTYTGRASVTEISTDTTIMVSGNNYSFNGDIPRLLIRFSYPVYSPANTVRVKYRLIQDESDNPKWNNSNNNAVEFSSLNPGNYIFQLKPDLKKENNTNITSFHFTIRPLWWQTTTAKALFSIAVIGVVALFFVQNTKRKYELRVASLKQMSILDKERSRIASDMHDDIGADLTQISMLANIVKVSNDKRDEFIKKIGQTSDEMLRKIDHIIWTLDPEHDHLRDLIYFIHERISRYLETSEIKFHFKTEGDIPNYKIDAIKRRNVFLVVKELVHNSVKHSGATNIEIQVYYINYQLHIIYSENGKGYILAEVTPGLGHTTLRKRMEEIESTLDLQSGPGKGVVAHLIIPVRENTIDASV